MKFASSSRKVRVIEGSSYQELTVLGFMKQNPLTAHGGRVVPLQTLLKVSSW